MCVGPVQERAGQRDDRAGHGGREQHGVPLLRQHPHDPLDVGQEAQVEHLVGLVEDQGLHPAEHQVPLLGQVEQPAGGADHHVDAPAQGGQLRLVGPAAVDRGDPDAQVLAGVGEVGGHLHAQLAGGHHDQRLRHVLGPVGGLAVGVRGRLLGRRGEPLQQRDAEAQRLAHAGAGLADDVVAGQRQRQGQLLDGERAHDAGLGQRAHDLGADAQLGEGGGVLADRGAGLQRVRLDDVVASGSGSAGAGECSVGVGGCVGRTDGQDDRLSPHAGARGRLVDHRLPCRIHGRPGGRAVEALHAPGRCGAGTGPSPSGRVRPADRGSARAPIGRCAGAQRTRYCCRRVVRHTIGCGDVRRSAIRRDL